MTFDDILDAVGGFGRYQKRFLAVVCVTASLFSSPTMFMHIFISAVPMHQCKLPVTTEKRSLLNGSLTPSEVRYGRKRTKSSNGNNLENLSHLNIVGMLRFGSNANLSQTNIEEL